MLSSRVAAIIVWLGVAIAWILTLAVRNRSMRDSLSAVLRSALTPPTSTVVIYFHVYLALWLWLAAQVGVWSRPHEGNPHTGAVSGLAVLFSADKADDEPAYFRKAIRRMAITVMIVVFFGIVSFSLLAELTIQPVFA